MFQCCHSSNHLLLELHRRRRKRNIAHIFPVKEFRGATCRHISCVSIKFAPSKKQVQIFGEKYCLAVVLDLKSNIVFCENIVTVCVIESHSYLFSISGGTAIKNEVAGGND